VYPTSGLKVAWELYYRCVGLQFAWQIIDFLLDCVAARCCWIKTGAINKKSDNMMQKKNIAQTVSKKSLMKKIKVRENDKEEARGRWIHCVISTRLMKRMRRQIAYEKIKKSITSASSSLFNERRLFRLLLGIIHNKTK
jgi:hypothetical protein